MSLLSPVMRFVELLRLEIGILPKSLNSRYIRGCTGP